MKILYSCLSKSWGGMEMVTLTSIKQLQNRDIKVELLCIKESRIHIEANNMGILLHPIKAAGYFHPFSSIKLAAIINKNEYDLVHTQASKDLWLIVTALKILNSKIPLILTKHVGSFINKKDKLHRWIYNRVDKAFAISKLIENNLIETTPLTREKVILMHNGIDTKKFDPEKVDNKKVREEFNLEDEQLVIGMLARFTPGKGHEEFLFAANELNKHHYNLTFMIVGEASRGEDEYAEKIKKKSKEYELTNVIFTGFRADTPEVLAAMDIFIFPSHSEAFGIALVEAMAMGKPSVCSNTHGILDIAIDNKTGLLFENKNEKDLTEKIDQLISSPDKEKEFGKAARKRAVEKFDIELLTDKTIDIYNELIN